MQPPFDLSLILTTLLARLAANIPVKRTSSTHQNEEFTMNKHATRHRGRHYYNRTAIYWHLIVVVSPMATHAGLFTTARAPCIYPRIHCMLTCRLEAALSYTLPVDTIFTIARYRIYHFLQSRAAGLAGLILCVHSRLVKSSACEVCSSRDRYAETSCNL